jgi:arylsulfatase A-like enzyme
MREKTRRQRTWGRYLRFAYLGIHYGARLSTLIEATEEILFDPLRGRSLDAARLFAKRKLRAKLNCDYFVELRRRHPVDFAAFYTNIVHVAQAYFWKYHEPAAFEGVQPEEIARYGESVHDAYRIADGFLGRILDDTTENDLVVLVSDHGAEAASEDSRNTLTLRLEPMLKQMRLKGAVVATNLGARTYLRMIPGHEDDRDRVRRLFLRTRLAHGGASPFHAKVDEWGNVVVTVNQDAVQHLDDTLLFQGGRCSLASIVRAVEFQESAQMKETGALVMSGKGVTPGRRIEKAHLLDLVPTVLVLTGLDLAADLPGDVIHEALEPNLRDRIPGVVATYDR